MQLASMKGGFNNPPNTVGKIKQHHCELASMKGGFNNPPNHLHPNTLTALLPRFNEGGV